MPEQERGHRGRFVTGDLASRFWTKVHAVGPTECWWWTGAVNKVTGYGVIGVGSRQDGTRSTSYAHRVAYELAVGPIPDGLHIDHLCRNRACVNPSHLEPVTNQENCRRSPLIGRHPNSRRRSSHASAA